MILSGWEMLTVTGSDHNVFSKMSLTLQRTCMPSHEALVTADVAAVSCPFQRLHTAESAFLKYH